MLAHPLPAPNDWHTPDQWLTKIQDVMNHPLMRGTPAANPSYIPAQKFSMALLDLLRDGSHAPLFTQAEATVNNLPDGQLKKTLSVFIRDAGGDVDKLRTHIETWFDDAMAELSAIYKHLSRFAMIILGLIVAVVLNVDSIRVARFLWASPAAAGDLADAAQQAKNGGSSQPAAAQEAAGQAALTKLRGFKLPIGWDFSEAKPATEGTAPAAADSQTPASPDPCANITAGADHNQLLTNVQQCYGLAAETNWLVHIPGWLITAIAVSLGAPFWFGLMQTLFNLRTNTKPPRADAKPAPKTS
jgi:hypothetical protein